MKDLEELLSYDPISDTEQRVGKHHECFSRADSLLALSLASIYGKERTKILKENKDTYFSMSWDYLIDILKDNGFKLGTEWSFIDDQWDTVTNEKAVIYYCDDGIVIYAESFDNGKTVNSGRCYYELEKKESVSDSDFYSLIKTGCGYGGNRLENEIDIREGLFFHLNKAALFGNFVNKWENRRYLWILDYMESHTKISHDAKYEVYRKQYSQITNEHISKCPKELQDIVECSLND